jgi:hypothetical protein
MSLKQIRQALGCAVAAAAGVGAAFAISGSSASAATQATSGVTLCAGGKANAVTYAPHGHCPAHTKRLAVAPQTQLTKLRAKVTSLTKQVAALQATLEGVSRTKHHGIATLTVSGENLQVVNGTGNETTVNGLGNLILGYNDNPDALDRTGSHNLVIGNDNGYTSYGGVVAGYGNLISGMYASASGGFGNSATGDYSSVSGGTDNKASGTWATVIGGDNNVASGTEASITGGILNTASGSGSSILGGYDGTVSTNDCASFPANSHLSAECA